MGVQNLAVVGVGLAATELCETHDEFEELYGDQEHLQLISPWYDASYQYCEAAIVVYQVESGTIDLSMVSAQQAIFRAMDEFRKITGKSGKIFLSTYGY